MRNVQIAVAAGQFESAKSYSDKAGVVLKVFEDVTGHDICMRAVEVTT